MYELMLEIVQQDFKELIVGHQGNGHSPSLAIMNKGIEYHCVYTVHVQPMEALHYPLWWM